MQSFHATALYDYEPANEDELELCEGDEILVTMCRDDDWFSGTNLETNLSGLFPGNYVEKIDGSDTKADNYSYPEEDRSSRDPPEGDEAPAVVPPSPPDSDPAPKTTEAKNPELPPRPARDAAPAQKPKKAARGRREKPTLKCAYWAQNTGIFAGACALMLGLMNFVWWSRYFNIGEPWPIQNKKITNPFFFQGLYGIGKMGDFPTLLSGIKPTADDIRDAKGELLYISKVGVNQPMNDDELKIHFQTNSKEPVGAMPDIQKLAGAYTENNSAFSAISAFIGPYTMLVGLISILVECCCTVKRPKEGCIHKSKCSCVGIAYIVLSIPMFATAPTCLVGLMYVLSSVPHFLASSRKEFGEDKICCGARQGGGKHWTSSALFDKDRSCSNKCTESIDGIRRGNQVGACVFLAVWLLANLCLAIERFIEQFLAYQCSTFMRDDKMWGIESDGFYDECCIKVGDLASFYKPVVEGTEGLDKRSCSENLADPYGKNFLGITDSQTANPKLRIEISPWIVLAKVFGQLLNLNCALVILPVARTFIGFLSNKLLATRGKLSAVIPIQKNVTFHKMIAKSILIFAALHTVTHFMAIADKPAHYYDNLQLSPWITGYLIIFAQFCIYPAATDVVRRAMFRVFWGNHHMFILFLGALLVHGWWFWLWLLVPALLYLAERVGRVCRGNKTFFVKRIKWIPPVMEVQFCPLQKSDFFFKEGQYLYLRCPYLDTNPLNPEYHPFTISSAHGDLIHKDFVSCHIKIQPGGWTERLKNYFEDMNPGQEYPFHLKRIDEKGERQDGKQIGIDGQQLLCVDGPHSSPSQHYDAYRRCMVVGAGIGMTPCASILRGTLLYKWKRDFYPESLYFFWTVRHSELGSFQWFVSLITKLMTKHEMNKQAGNIGAKNNVQIHIYVTSYNAKANEQRRIQTLKDRGSSKVLRASRIAAGNTDIGFTIDDLWERLHEPNGPPKEFLERVCPRPGYVPDNKVGPNIYVWNGRPAWDPVFMSVGAEPGAKDTDVGVCYCGNAIIAKQLQDSCIKFSDPDKVMFRLHKENF